MSGTVHLIGSLNRFTIVAVDVHQHIWPEPFVEALCGGATSRVCCAGRRHGLAHRSRRASRRAPSPTPTTTSTRGSRCSTATASTARSSRRAAPRHRVPAAGRGHRRRRPPTTRACWSSPDALRAWAMAPLVEPDPAALDAVLAPRPRRPGAAGLRPRRARRVGALRARCSTSLVARGRPLMIHPGPRRGVRPGPRPATSRCGGPPSTAYVADMAASWFGYLAWGRELVSRPRRSASPCSPGSRRCTTSASLPAPATRCRSCRATCSWRRRRTARAASTP